MPTEPNFEFLTNYAIRICPYGATDTLHETAGPDGDYDTVEIVVHEFDSWENLRRDFKSRQNWTKISYGNNAFIAIQTDSHRSMVIPSDLAGIPIQSRLRYMHLISSVRDSLRFGEPPLSDSQLAKVGF